MRSSSAHLFVADLAEPVVDPEDLHHLARVLRLQAGETVSVSDGAGGWRACAWTGAGVEPAGEVQHDPRPDPPVTVAFVPVKGDRPEWAVQKLTEVGVDRVVVMSSARAVVRWEGDRGDRNLARLRRVAREAAMQSRRTWLPRIEGVVAFAELAAEEGTAMAEPGGEAPSLDRPAVLVGPEGGWSEEEAAAGPARVSLGVHVLRAETAAVAAGVLLCGIRHGLVAPP